MTSSFINRLYCTSTIAMRGLQEHTRKAWRSTDTVAAASSLHPQPSAVRTSSPLRATSATPLRSDGAVTGGRARAQISSDQKVVTSLDSGLDKAAAATADDSSDEETADRSMEKLLPKST